ncbi:hypothetical protein [Fictibacillus gelatini]|uniref:hypothetical protein n=1 Tax=Fictibacillus gelatini TaxID=225985 RepID=UPI00041B606C|nr:hypothetical protein [Fictibacillus gelatini]
MTDKLQEFKSILFDGNCNNLSLLRGIGIDLVSEVERLLDEEDPYFISKCFDLENQLQQSQHEAETAKEFVYQMIEDKRLLQQEIDSLQEELDKFKNSYLAAYSQLVGIKKQYIQTSNKLRQQREVTQKLEEKLQKKRKESEF